MDMDYLNNKSLKSPNTSLILHPLAPSLLSKATYTHCLYLLSSQTLLNPLTALDSAFIIPMKLPQQSLHIPKSPLQKSWLIAVPLLFTLSVISVKYSCLLKKISF